MALPSSTGSCPHPHLQESLLQERSLQLVLEVVLEVVLKVTLGVVLEVALEVAPESFPRRPVAP